MHQFILPPALRATSLINAGGKAFAQQPDNLKLANTQHNTALFLRFFYGKTQT